MPNASLLTIGSLLAGVLLSNCSQPAATTEAAGASASEAPAAIRGRPSRADSLNGIPGHQFGDPLSSFPGLQLAGPQQPGMQSYAFPPSKTANGWFGKHKAEVPYVLYTFKDGKFAAFEAIAYAEGSRALREETMFLLGPGIQNTGSTTWLGEKVQASFTSRTLPAGPADILRITSQTLLRDQASARADRLKRENADQ